jgi:hypothetical protein
VVDSISGTLRTDGKTCVNVNTCDVLANPTVISEELDGRAVSALGVRSWKLSTSLNGQS